ncbi:hypothetical protein H0H87_012570 [Tephrocybe sp. NHM501043]|nr:hypothetical protein H0H87_012570 [Tephrocybe sp. NHM501043]
MERIAPLRLAESWDNVRRPIVLSETVLINSDRAYAENVPIESPVRNLAKKRVLLTIDLTTAVLDEAIVKDASVIVSYHPPIFKGLQALTLKTPLQSSLLQCAAQGISVYSPHTAVDSVWGGVNDWLADGVLDGKDNGSITSLVGDKLSPSGVTEGGEGRLVTFKSAISMSVLETRIKKHLKLPQIQVGYGALPNIAPITTVAICAGSGGSMLVGKSADVYFTGEMSHHEVLAAVASGKHVILCGHDNTERGYLPDLASKLRHELERDNDLDVAGVEVIVSQNDKHPLQNV